MILNVFSDENKFFIDFIAIGTTISTVMGWLPSVAAGFTIVWTAIRIVESKTFQQFWNWLRGNGSALS